VKGAVMAAGIMKSMAVAGTALSVVGAATKNQKLAKIGAVVGGIGTLGTMGAFGAGAKTLGMSASAKAAAAAKAASAATPMTATRSALQSSVSPTLKTATTGRAGGLLASGVTPMASPAVTAAAPRTLLGTVGGALKTAGNWVSKNPELAQVLAAGTGEVANFLSGKTDAEIREMESKIDVNDATARTALEAIEQEKRRRQNLNQGYLTVNPVIGLPGQPNPYQSPGLLAQNMPGVKP
jgi:hypothetical protein